MKSENLIVKAAGVLFLSRSTGRCLFQLRNSSRQNHDTWGFFGGTMDEGETPYECIQRELEEEIGFVPDIVKLNPIDIYQSTDKNFYYYSFVAVVDSEFIPDLNEESAGYAWVDIGRWPKPLHRGAKSTLEFNGGESKLDKILAIHA